MKGTRLKGQEQTAEDPTGSDRRQKRPASAVVSIVLGSYNRQPFLREAVQSVRSNGITVPYEIIVIDGGSTDGALEWLCQQPDIITIVQHNRTSSRGEATKRRSWGYFMNLGFKCAEGRFIVMISDDSLLIPGSVMNAVQHYENLSNAGHTIGAVAFYWRNWPEQREYWVGLTHGEKLFVNHGLYLRAALQEVGWIEEEQYRFYCADGDLCLKLWEQGYEVVDCPSAFVEHFSHANVTLRQGNFGHEPADRQAYQDRWRGIFYDPAKPNQRDWIYLAHEDRTGTAEGFLRAKQAVSSPHTPAGNWIWNGVKRLWRA